MLIWYLMTVRMKNWILVKICSNRKLLKIILVMDQKMNQIKITQMRSLRRMIMSKMFIINKVLSEIRFFKQETNYIIEKWRKLQDLPLGDLGDLVDLGNLLSIIMLFSKHQIKKLKKKSLQNLHSGSQFKINNKDLRTWFWITNTIIC